MQRTCFTVFNAWLEFSRVRVFCNERVRARKLKAWCWRSNVTREICTLRVVVQLCAAVLPDSSESTVVRHERPKGICATRCQLSHRSRRILRDTLPRENDDYVRGSTRRFYTFPLNQPLTSLRMRRALRFTIDKRPREASQFDRRDSFLTSNPRGRAREEDSAMCVTGKTYEQEMDEKSTFES